jgi:thiol:disulfide interchange protein DsbA
MKKTSLGVALILAFLCIGSAAWPRSAVGAGSTDMFLLSFGKGRVEVKLYSDYFCGACRNLEPNVEYLIADLVQRNIITITFVDAPLHTHSPLYARYFLYILNGKKEIGHALKARRALFEAAQQNISDSGKLESFLTTKGFKLKTFDVAPVFSVLQGYLRSDNIRATPTAVILWDGKREFHQGVPNITRMFEGLK